MDHTRSERVDLGLAMAEEAGRMAHQYFETVGLNVETKADGSPVTQADRAIELALREMVSARFPDDAFSGEEFPDTDGGSGFRWIVDPIDGTKSFVRGVPLYANLVALQRDDEIVFGVINLPSAGVLVHAERGGGCWRNGVRVHVSDRAALDGAYVMATWLEDWDPNLIGGLHDKGAVVRTWGDAFGYAMVASGQADAVVDYRAHAFDLAPMPVIIEEAGGRFTSLDGRRVIDGGNGIASNGLIHDALLPWIAPQNTDQERGIRI
ncbi:inositol monophosphatase family protein [Mycolicibacterium vaccae]|uniref:inositol monophosphatase family protein n=1 Tax=Mycolicibacterium vaccae TaxID=1810 RepID=UPI003CFCDBFA